MLYVGRCESEIVPQLSSIRFLRKTVFIKPLSLSVGYRLEIHLLFLTLKYDKMFVGVKACLTFSYSLLLSLVLRLWQFSDKKAS